MVSRPASFSLRAGLTLALAVSLLVVAAPAATPGTHATFSSVCQFSHALPDDPIVFPDEPGASHLHDFLGNVTTDAYSTYDSLRAGDTTCDRAGDTAAYWVPALYRADGTAVQPRSMSAYYRAVGKDGASIQAPPADLRIISSEATWVCPGTLGLSDPLNGCPIGNLQLQLRFPDCWDGVNLDSADHRSHMAFSSRVDNEVQCPDSHPVSVPLVDLHVRYQDVTAPGWYLASGGADTSHGDFLNAWDQEALETLVARCLNTGLGIGTSLVC